ncbi:hypothetical protein WM40_22620 [Robbsia andropogonis]|uniref:Uncharacterized protein n=1 Tax=Robbsia andropogonis TaxID=28092 RepID=A0A0F5JWA2_9BURK|nr:Rmf/CrpP family protein [Robbsia andropogonis]KKB61537.1 hypothetical protein WM40_22620 [Robbsia andropogonis]
MLSRAEIEKAMSEGAEAYQSRMKRTNNPYPMFTDQHASWLRGYQNAHFGASLAASARQNILT